MSGIIGAWGKRDETGRTHLLEHHCADVAACFEAMAGDPVVRARFDEAAGESGLDEVSLARLTVLAFFHDFGKVNSGFQFGRSPSSRAHPPNATEPRMKFVGHIKASIWACKRSEVVGALGFPDLVQQWGGDAFQELLCASLAHHGRPATLRSASGRGPCDIWQPSDSYDPMDSCRKLLARSRRWFPRAFEPASELRTTPSLTHLFAGMVAIADQIGSHEDLFPFEPDADPDYIERARQRARDAVRKLGLTRADWRALVPVPCLPRDDFATLFDLPSPRPLQTAVADAPLDRPLVILESETGSGKTEAALWRFAKLWRAGLVDGLYFALPTRAAATQIHERVHRVIKKILPSEARAETVLAIPGYLKAGKATGRLAGRFSVEWFDDPDESKQFSRWSAENARKFLASASAVGTVDQVLMAGLKVKWAHFRGSALARSLLVVDEVHASDAYMTELLHAILQGHLRVGGHALLMSATLGSRARDHLVARKRPRIQDGTEVSAATGVPYPALTMVGDRGGVDTKTFESTGYSRTVSMEARPILQHPIQIAQLALREARQGAKVLVIRNTVKQARRVFEELRKLGAGDLLLRAGDGPALHHSRFAAEDRTRLDRAVERELGRDRTPGGRVVLGTQTLEQSLDIDADLLLTDLCPVDVLLQRIGRLHRHSENTRPDAFSVPKCMVFVPEGVPACFLDGNLLAYGLGISKQGGGVYRDVRVAELTRRLIVGHPGWEIPEMNRMLVEEGTHPRKLRELETKLGPAWSDRGAGVDGTMAHERQIACDHRMTRKERFLNLRFPDLDESVRTRLGDTGPRIKLAEPQRGPFGHRVATFSLPGHWFRGEPGFPSRGELDGATAERTEDGLILRVGASKFAYDRTGLRRRS